MRPLRASAWRDLVRHPLQSGLAVLGVALGVAVALAIQLASASSLRAMQLSAEAAGGRATHRIVGGATGLPELLFTRVRLELGLRPSAPVVEEDVPVVGRPGEVLHLLGIDPFCEAPFRSYVGPAGAGVDLAAFLTEPGAVLLARETADRLGVAVGGAFELAIGAERRAVRLVGVLEPADEHTARLASDVLVADVATAQELLGQEGTLSRIDLILDRDEAETRALLVALERVLPADVVLEEAGARAGALAAMTRGFRVNLQALSLLSLVVGLFLVYNAALFSVVRRSRELAVLRCVGATRAQVLGMVLGGAAALGALGSAVGVAAGVLLARGLVRMVTGTINDLYFALSVREIALEPELVGGAFLLGLVTTVAGALAPGLEATRADPRGARRRSDLEARARRALPRFAVAGVLLLAGGLAMLARGGAGVTAAFGGLFATIVGCALLVPPATVLVLRGLARPLAAAAGAPGALAVRGSERSLSRTSVALAALVVALSTATAVAVLISSFRTSVVTWLETSFVADVYAGPPATTRTRAPGALPDEAVRALVGVPGVQRALRYRSNDFPSERGSVQVVALDTSVEGAVSFHFADGGSDADRVALASGAACFVTEPLAHRLDLARGDALVLDTPRGAWRLAIAAVVHDYGSDRGNALVDLAAYRAATGDVATGSLALWLEDGTDVDGAVARLRAAIPAGLAVVVRSNEALRNATLVVFDRTFAVTGVLRFVTLLVALIGLVSALMALGLDRARELAVLRALGATPAQVRRLLALQALLLGLVAGALALPVSALVARLMIDVVNRRTFGWSLLAFDFGPGRIVATLLLAGVTAWLASLLPAWLATREDPSPALRQE